MVAFTNTVDIARPIEDVFAYLADFTNIPDWNYYIMRVEQRTDGPIGIGTVFHQTRRDDEQRYELVGFDPPRELTVSTLPGEAPAFTRTLRLTPLPDGSTRIRDDWELDTGHPALLQRVLGGRVRSAVADNLDHLRQLLEEGRTRLQDGRVVTRDD